MERGSNLDIGFKSVCVSFWQVLRFVVEHGTKVWILHLEEQLENCDTRKMICEECALMCCDRLGFSLDIMRKTGNPKFW